MMKSGYKKMLARHQSAEGEELTVLEGDARHGGQG
ncbi:hypothetical protein SAMN06298226_1014 [Nitrosovibrio sp. Nv4]|nr:hypothetical protein SAMN06298226_1014 [Nitrosovibrio sp. Nv4]